MDESGKVISPASNKLTFTHSSGNNADFETILTAEQAANYTLDKVFTSWKPDNDTKQIDIPSATISNNVISWEAAENAIMYAVFKDNVIVGVTAETSYMVEDVSAGYTVRAANAMGGFGKTVSVDDPSAIESVTAAASADTKIYNLAGQRLKKAGKGINIIGGKKVIVK